MNKNLHIETLIRREISRPKEWQKCKLKTGLKNQFENDLKFTRTYTFISGNLSIETEKSIYYFSKEIDNYIYKLLINRFMETLQKRVAIEKTTTRELKKRLLDKVISQVAPLTIDWLDELCSTETEKSAKLIDFVKSIFTAKNDTDGLNKMHKFFIYYFAHDTEKSAKCYNAFVGIQQERKEANKQESKAVKAVKDAYNKMLEASVEKDTAINNLRQMVAFGVLKDSAVNAFLEKLDTDTDTEK